MYTIQALWTAAHHRLPLTVVLVNNGGYRIIRQRLLAMHGSRRFVGMDFADPPVDFAALAASMGLESVRIDDPGTLGDVLASAFRRPGPKLVELMVDGSV
jgi:benzoylformate decarboxylase